MLPLDLQIEDRKRKSTIICDFVIETAYLKELATQVFNADDKAQQSPAFHSACQNLKRLCETVETSVRNLKAMVPLEMMSPEAIVAQPLD